MSVQHEVKMFIVDQFARDVQVAELDDDYDLLDNGVVDSLSLLRLIAWVGDRFEIPVDDVDLTPDNFRSVSAIGEFIAAAGALSGAGQ